MVDEHNPPCTNLHNAKAIGSGAYLRPTNPRSKYQTNLDFNNPKAINRMEQRKFHSFRLLTTAANQCVRFEPVQLTPRHPTTPFDRSPSPPALQGLRHGRTLGLIRANAGGLHLRTVCRQTEVGCSTSDGRIDSGLRVIRNE
jgi:hypothetical protein